MPFSDRACKTDFFSYGRTAAICGQCGNGRSLSKREVSSIAKRETGARLRHPIRGRSFALRFGAAFADEIINGRSRLCGEQLAGTALGSDYDFIQS